MALVSEFLGQLTLSYGMVSLGRTLAIRGPRGLSVRVQRRREEAP